MELRQLRYFVAVVDAGSLTNAAKSLFVTQPALSASLRKLEADLRTPLFRPGGRTELTAAGQLLYEEGAVLLTQLTDLKARVRTFDQTPTESLRVGLTVLFSMQFMRQISRFMTSHLPVEVTLVHGGSRELQGALARGEIDLGLLSFPQVASDVVIEPLNGPTTGYDVSVVMRRDNPLAAEDFLEVGDLDGQRFSSLSNKFVLGHLLPQRCEQVGFEPEIVFRNDSWEVVLSSILELDTVAFLPSPFKELTTHDDLAWIPLHDKAAHFPIGIATRKGETLSASARDFVEAIRQPG